MKKHYCVKPCLTRRWSGTELYTMSGVAKVIAVRSTPSRYAAGQSALGENYLRSRA
jgi:hypothetical protein